MRKCITGVTLILLLLGCSQIFPTQLDNTNTTDSLPRLTYIEIFNPYAPQIDNSAIPVGGYLHLAVRTTTAQRAVGSLIQWNIENLTGSATISQDGLVHGVSEGFIKIIVNSTDGSDLEDSFDMYVHATQPGISVNITKDLAIDTSLPFVTDISSLESVIRSMSAETLTTKESVDVSVNSQEINQIYAAQLDQQAGPFPLTCTVVHPETGAVYAKTLIVSVANDNTILAEEKDLALVAGDFTIDPDEESSILTQAGVQGWDLTKGKPVAIQITSGGTEPTSRTLVTDKLIKSTYTLTLRATHRSGATLEKTIQVTFREALTVSEDSNVALQISSYPWPLPIAAALTEEKALHMAEALAWELSSNAVLFISVDPEELTLIQRATAPGEYPLTFIAENHNNGNVVAETILVHLYDVNLLINIPPTGPIVGVDSSITLGATILSTVPTEDTLVWAITHGETLASIGEDTGILTAGPTPGVIELRATLVHTGVEAFETITIVGLTVTGEPTMTPGSIQTLSATFTSEGTPLPDIRWNTRSNFILNVNKRSGEVMAKRPGTGIITATDLRTGLSANYTVTIE